MKPEKTGMHGVFVLLVISATLLGSSVFVQADAPSGVLKQAIHWGLSADWLDPATNPGLISSCHFLPFP